MPFLASLPLLSSLFYFAAGALFGSFGNVLVLRLPEGKGIGGRSRCPHCNKILTADELVPLFSYFLLHGRCSGCDEKISWLYPFIEALSGVLFLVALFHERFFFPQSAALAFALWLLLLLAAMDARTGMVADALTIPFVAVSFLYALLSPPFPVFAPLIGAGVFAAQWFASRGRWVGSGDILAGAGVGFLLLDWRLAVMAILLAYIIGACAAAGLMAARKKTRKDHVPFIPFLATATVLTLLVGDTVLAWYL